jgi:hypothetical protein
MLEPHSVGGEPSSSKTMDQLAAAGIETQPTDPSFTLTHEKGIPILRNVSPQLYCVALLFLLSWPPVQQKGNQRLIIRILTCALKRYHPIGELRAYSR